MVVPELVQIKALIPRELKKRAFIALAETDRKFTPWLREQLERMLEQLSKPGETHACTRD
jgi:hypothetical protein